MNYILRNLEHDERIIAKARIHWWFNLKRFGLLNMFNQLWITDRRILQKTGIFAVRTSPSIWINWNPRMWSKAFGDLLVYGSGGKVFHLRR